MKYWLMKTEPDVYGWDDLLAQPGRSDHWDGIRNYQARNFLRDMAVGDRVFFYHSRSKPPHIVGIARVVKTAYPDPTQFDADSDYHDPKSDPDNPRWDMVDVAAVGAFDIPIPIDELRDTPGLENMELLRKGSRLSVQPVRPEEWAIICALRPPID